MERRRRTKSNGISPRFTYKSASACSVFKMAASSGLRIPISNLLLRRSEEHTSELQSHSDLHSFPTRRSSDLNSFWRALGDEKLITYLALFLLHDNGATPPDKVERDLAALYIQVRVGVFCLQDGGIQRTANPHFELAVEEIGRAHV